MNFFIELKKDLINQKIMLINDINNKLKTLHTNGQTVILKNKPLLKSGETKSFTAKSIEWRSLCLLTDFFYKQTIIAEELKFQRAEESMLLLSLAKQTIARIHKSGFPPNAVKTKIFNDPDIYDYRLIRNGRNQGMHCDEPSMYNEYVKILFKELNKISNSYIDLDKNPTKNYSYEILKYLKWTDDPDFMLLSLDKLTSAIDFNNWDIILNFVSKSTYSISFFNENNIFYSLPEVYNMEYSKNIKLVNDFLIFLKTDSFYNEFQIMKKNKLIPIKKISELTKCFERFTKDFLKTNLEVQTKSFSIKDFE